MHSLIKTAHALIEEVVPLDHRNRQGLQDTPKRFATAMQEWTSGYHFNAESILVNFEDGGERYDELVVVKDIPVYSLCEHHLAPFFGVAHVAYLPAGRVVGLSKIARVVDVYARRLQVQERLTQEIAHCLMESQSLKPRGVAALLQCRHLCMESRGVRRPGVETVTSCMLGAFKTDLGLRSEALTLFK